MVFDLISFYKLSMMVLEHKIFVMSMSMIEHLNKMFEWKEINREENQDFLMYVIVASDVW